MPMDNRTTITTISMANRTTMSSITIIKTTIISITIKET